MPRSRQRAPVPLPNRQTTPRSAQCPPRHFGKPTDCSIPLICASHCEHLVVSVPSSQEPDRAHEQTRAGHERSARKDDDIECVIVRRIVRADEKPVVSRPGATGEGVRKGAPGTCTRVVDVPNCRASRILYHGFDAASVSIGNSSDAPHCAHDPSYTRTSG